MGLYLTIFREDVELEGVEIGSYSDFEHLRLNVQKYVEEGKWGSRCPVFMLHEDSDGHWTHKEAKKLEKELRKISRCFEVSPALIFENGWQKELIEAQGIETYSLKDCFFDVDGHPLFKRLEELVKLSQKTKLPILFQ